MSVASASAAAAPAEEVCESTPLRRDYLHLVDIEKYTEWDRKYMFDLD